MLPETRREIVRAESIPAKDVPTANQQYVKVRLDLPASTKELHQENPVQLARMILSVVDTEAPVHIAEARHRLLEAFGVSRGGSRINAAVEEAIRLGVQQQSLSVAVILSTQLKSDP